MYVYNHFFMTTFSDSHVRDTFIIGLVTTLSEIFVITESNRKEAIYNELHAMDDESLLRKKDLIENYLEQTRQFLTKEISQVVHAMHAQEEMEEKEALTINF